MNKKDNTKETKQKKLKYFLGGIITIFFIFFLGIFAVVSVFNSLPEKKTNLSTYSLNHLLISFLFVTGIILFIVFSPIFEKNRNKIYRVFFSLSSFYGMFVFFFFVFSAFGKNDYLKIIAIFFSAALFFWWQKKSFIILHNLLIGFALAGISAMLGLSVKPETALLAMVIISFYDFIAVYKTRHMIKMAQSMLNSGVIMGLIIPPSTKEMFFNTKKIKIRKNFFIIGGGDIVFPLTLIISLIPFGVNKAISMGVFSFLGIILSFSIYFTQKEKKPIPALPPIALCCIMGYIFINFLYSH